jgi:hypothetical protein
VNGEKENLESATQQLKQANARLWQPWDSEGPDTFYHYCGIEGMRGIFSSGHIWASDVMCLNDPSEIQYASELILHVLKSRPEVPDFIRLVFTLRQRLLDQVEDWRIRVFCMCEKADDLSQWRAYGKGGGGFAVGLNRLRLLDVAEPHESAPFALVRIMYDEASQVQRVNTLIDEACRIFRAATLPESVHWRYWHEFGFELLTFLCRFKAPAFGVEAEWRLLSIAPKEQDEFRPKAGSYLVPYVSLALPKDALSELWQGPTLNAEFALRSLARFLVCCGYGQIRPKQSAIRLRS